MNEHANKARPNVKNWEPAASFPNIEIPETTTFANWNFEKQVHA